VISSESARVGSSGPDSTISPRSGAAVAQTALRQTTNLRSSYW
jgi:hypothetical protein